MLPVPVQRLGKYHTGIHPTKYIKFTWWGLAFTFLIFQKLGFIFTF